MGLQADVVPVLNVPAGYHVQLAVTSLIAGLVALSASRHTAAAAILRSSTTKIWCNITELQSL